VRGLDELAIFPLPDAVLFPGMFLPLHVFEPRYRDMTRDVLAGSRLMAVARLQPGFERDYLGRPPIHPVAGIGEVIDSRETADGRYYIILRGTARARVDDELPPELAYRRARASLIDDSASRLDAAGLDDRREQLLSLCELAANTFDGGAELRDLARAAPGPGTCADIVCAALVTDADERQALLETFDPAPRLDRAIEHLARLLTRLAPTEGQPN
jgi:Lon protease-like protein